MQIPEWVKPGITGAICGAVVITIIGFSADWVVTSGTASQMAETEAESAVLAALAPICVAQFKAETDAMRTTSLAALEEESSWKRSDYIVDHGWATMPGMAEPNEEVAETCADKLIELATT